MSLSAAMGLYLVLLVSIVGLGSLVFVTRGAIEMYRSIFPPPAPLAGQRYIIDGLGEVKVFKAGEFEVCYLLPGGRSAIARAKDWRAYNPTLITSRAEAMLAVAREVEETLETT